MISVRNLEKTFHTLDGDLQVLKGINQEIRKGEKIVVVGPSGSGKSTFLRCLNLLETPTGGEIWFEGTQINAPGTDVDRLRQKMGMVFQHFNLFPHLSVKQNITLAPVCLKLTDEPELGLHPAAINKLAELAKRASHKSQIILSTQSTNLLNCFDVEDIIVVDRADNQSVFRHLSGVELEKWMDDYNMSISDLWEKNMIGGQL